MALVATLVSDPVRRALDPDRARRAAAAVGADRPDWLAEGVACDIAPAGADVQAVERALRAAIEDAPIDVVIQEASTRRKMMLIADMDSTMIGQECVDELAAEVGLKAEVSAITARAMNGEIAFEPALRERVALLKNLPLSTIEAVLSSRITLTPGGRELIATMKANGAYTALVSGGFTLFTRAIAATLGFDEHRANILEESDGRLVGTVREPILGRQAKVDALHDISGRLALAPSDALAVGDGANDLGMLQLAGSGVALHAKPAVAAAARMRIDHADLTALLYIQGYRAEEFVANAA